MRLTLRTRFFLWLMGFMLFCFALNYSADLAFDFAAKHMARHEAEPTPGVEFLGLLSVNVAVMPVVLALGWWMARRMSRPVAEAADLAERIAGGQLSERMPVPDGPMEIHRLVQALNKAFDRYESDLRRMQRFSADAAHQLRTPLAALRAEVEVTLNRPRTSMEYQESLRVVLERLQTWSHSVEQMLALAELENEKWVGRFQEVDLAKVLHRVRDGLSVLAEEKAIAIASDLPATMLIPGDENLLEQLFANLLDNAIRFTPRGGRIQILLRADPSTHGAAAAIEDNGPGIPPEQRKQVLERFSKGNRPDTAGAGLGLPIAVEIVRLHHGSLRLSDQRPHGTRADVWLPAGGTIAPDARSFH